MEPDAKPVVEHQRRLIPKMKEVVRNKVLKLHDASIIHPIADSRWVKTWPDYGSHRPPLLSHRKP
jgi:hypothetical protein